MYLLCGKRVACHSLGVEVREQLEGVHSLLPPCGYQGSTSDPYAWLDSKHLYLLSYLVLGILGVVLEMTSRQVLGKFYFIYWCMYSFGFFLTHGVYLCSYYPRCSTNARKSHSVGGL